MKNKFAKLFDFEENQVLVTKHNEQYVNNEFQVIQSTYCDSTEVSMTVGFNDMNLRDAYFDAFETQNASAFLGVISKTKPISTEES